MVHLLKSEKVRTFAAIFGMCCMIILGVSGLIVGLVGAGGETKEYVEKEALDGMLQTRFWGLRSDVDDFQRQLRYIEDDHKHSLSLLESKLVQIIPEYAEFFDSRQPFYKDQCEALLQRIDTQMASSRAYLEEFEIYAYLRTGSYCLFNGRSVPVKQAMEANLFKKLFYL